MSLSSDGIDLCPCFSLETNFLLSMIEVLASISPARNLTDFLFVFRDSSPGN